VKERPGITVEELSEAMGVGMKRTWQYIAKPERCGVWRERS
jgi:hypothetical protein